MQNSPDLLTRALQNPTLREAELGRRRARDGTDGDVLAWIEATFGVRIPAVACCEGHVAPAQAFCDALRARDQVALWIASRGFGGKTFLLALLAAANAILFETDVIILGGSGQQSLRVVEHLHRLWAAGQVPRAWLASEPSLNKTTLAWGNTIQALTASQTAVRGAHPTRLLLDEIDEMKLPILEAAQGQPMDRDGVRAQTVMSSTHQHPDGTVTAMRRRAADLGWPVSEWCYRETLKPHGWLTADQVVRKQAELSRTMWAVEYELQEPSAEGRAIDPPAVERMFDATLGTHGEFNWSSLMRCCNERRKRRRSDRAGRPAMRSPGRPPATGRAEQQRFWKAIARGLSSEDAAVSCGVSPPVGGRWFREGGGMPPISLAPRRRAGPVQREETCELTHPGCVTCPSAGGRRYVATRRSERRSGVSGVDCAVAQRPTCQAPEDRQAGRERSAEELRAGPPRRHSDG